MRKILSIILKTLGLVLSILGIVSSTAHVIYDYIYRDPILPGSLENAVIILVVGVIIYSVGSYINPVGVSTPREEAAVEPQKKSPLRREETSTTRRFSWKKLFTTLILLGVFSYCVGCMDEGDSLMAWMIIIYIPYYLFLSIYYIRLIWRYSGKISKEQLLLLPALQKIGLLKNYKPSERGDRQKLFSTSFYGLILSVLCPAIVATMYYDMVRGIREYYGLCYILLSLPVIAWGIGLARASFFDWLYLHLNKEV